MSSADQAAKLRQLISRRQEAALPATNARVIAVTGGKGGIGKTNVAANLAIAFASLGRKVAILDADYALANIDILLGFNPKHSIDKVLNGEMSVGEILVDGPGGIKVIPAASGIQRLTNLSHQQQNMLYNALQILEKHFDNLFIDTSAGISDEVINVLRAAGEILIVTNPEPPAFVDCYAMIKHLLSVHPNARLQVIVNLASSPEEGKLVFDRIAKTVSKFLNGHVGYLGYIAEDLNVRKAVRHRKAFILQYPNSQASRCVTNLARELLNLQKKENSPGFWFKLKSVLSGNNSGDKKGS